MTDALLQTLADDRATTGVRYRTMIDVYLALKINAYLVS
jgi:hypothetical protein